MQLGNHNGIPPQKQDILETTVLNILRNYNASMWLPGPAEVAGNYEDSNGRTPLATVNGLVGHVVDETYNDTAENAVKNSNFDNTVLGSVPPNWQTAAIAGMTTTFVGMGVLPSGDRYIDVRVTGTMGAAPGDIYFTEPNASAGNTYDGLVVGDLITASVDLALIDGSYPASGSVVVNCFGRLSTGGFGAVTYTTVPASELSSELRRFEASHIITNATHVKGHMGVRIGGAANGTVIDVTLRIARAQVQRGRNAAYIGTTENEQILSVNKTPVYQLTTGFKPKLVGGVANQIRQSRNPMNSNWTLVGTTRSSLGISNSIFGDIARVSQDTSTAQHSIRATFVSSPLLPDNSNITVVGYVRYVSGDSRYQLQLKNKAGAFVGATKFDLTSVVVIHQAGVGTYSCTLEKSVDGFVKFTWKGPVGVGAGIPQFVVFSSEGITVPGDPNTVWDIGGMMAVIGDTVPTIIPASSDSLLSGDITPYSWRFDGVDDRLELSKPFLNPAADHFIVVAFKMPDTVISAARTVVGFGNAGANERVQVVFVSSNVVNAFWRDAPGTTQPLLSSTTALPVNGRACVSMRRKGLNYEATLRREDLAKTDVSVAITTAAWTPGAGNIGCGVSGNTDVFFFNGEIYGVVIGNGTPTASEITALEDYLIGCAGFIPVP